MLERKPEKRLSLREIAETKWFASKFQVLPPNPSTSYDIPASTTLLSQSPQGNSNNPCSFGKLSGFRINSTSPSFSEETEFCEGKIGFHHFELNPKFLTSLGKEKTENKQQLLLLNNSFIMGSTANSQKSVFSMHSDLQSSISNADANKCESVSSSVIALIKMNLGIEEEESGQSVEKETEQMNWMMTTTQIRKEKDIFIEKAIGKMKEFECKWIKF